MPYSSLTKIKIVSKRDCLINLECLFNEKTEGMKVKVGLNFDNLKALDDFENFDMFESFPHLSSQVQQVH
ncbi:MAG: abortive infection system toxin AbiGii family protein [Streptococcus hyointestinalis]|nr:abortive infection system toxin AbiGii family protein [Streptococcus hyointestinalis]MDD6385636.1 abortive infection system toxin AbiGii family protein [Streptococcus hyointestinalis]